MRPSILSLLALCPVIALGVSSTGCIVVHDHPVDGRPVLPATCSVPSPVTYTASFPAYHVQAGQSVGVVAGDGAYYITSNGMGTYSVTWTNDVNIGDCFSGRITGIDNFNQSQVTGFSGLETVSLIAPNQIGFASTPGTAIDGVNFFAQQDPVYLDVYINASPSVNIYYPDGTTGLDTATGANPAAFLSP